MVEDMIPAFHSLQLEAIASLPFARIKSAVLNKETRQLPQSCLKP